MGVMLNSEFKLLVENGGSTSGKFIMKDGTRKSTVDQNGADPNVVGQVIQWNPTYRQGKETGTNGVQNPNGVDPGLLLVHELVGHGFQGTVRQLSPHTIMGTVQTPQGPLLATEADAQSMLNRFANATGRKDMVQSRYDFAREWDRSGNRIIKYKANGDVQPVGIIRYELPTPPYELNWNRTRKY
jgi:hypothetical protein